MEAPHLQHDPGHGNGDRKRLPLRVGSVLAGMRIRKKLVFLHTCFSLVLAGILALALRPAVSEVVSRAEAHEAQTVVQMELTRAGRDAAGAKPGVAENVELRVGRAEDVGLTPAQAQRVMDGRGEVVVLGETTGGGWTSAPRAGAYDAAGGRFVVAAVRLEGARSAVVRLYIAMTLALLAVYALVAAALEIFVLPEHVYEPIRRVLEADLAVQEGRREGELIPATAMPRDELGEIMRSRNESILTMRKHERDLAAALGQLEEVATDLKRKNHMLETAKRNLADADRLASLGMMSAGLAHEMNTPLAVLKGQVERLKKSIEQRGAAGNGSTSGLTLADAELMGRVVLRLERLSESLLDFARARPAATKEMELRDLVTEAWTLVSLDREAARVEFEDRVDAGTKVQCDTDRLVQVLVNLLRNAVDAMTSASSGATTGRIVVNAAHVEKDHRSWVSITITDSGPGIDPEILPRLFEPFASTRMDSRGTGLGLAVSEGIVSEHGGLLLARNRRDGTGAVFEILLPVTAVDRESSAADELERGSWIDPE